jgi:catecholate siderophore receptor
VSVVGVEGGHEKAAPLFENSSGVPTSSLLTPNENLRFTAASTYPRYKTHLSANSAAPFLINTATLDRWEATVGLRWDYFHVDYNDINYSSSVPGKINTTDHIPHLDEMFSYRAALAYKPLPNGSVYLSFGTSFNPSAEDLSLISSSRSFSLNNANLEPEKNRNYELGSKWSVLQGQLDLSGAIFRAEKTNARVPNPENILVNVLAGSQRVDGAEARVSGRVTSDWQLIAGYTYLDSKVTKTAPGAAPPGAPLMNTPKHAFSFWSVYELNRFELGGGAHFVGSQYTQNAPPIKTVPAYWTFDAMVKYAFTQRIAAQVNVNNVTNRYYYEQLHFFHVVPGEGRTALLTLQARF